MRAMTSLLAAAAAVALIASTAFAQAQAQQTPAQQPAAAPSGQPLGAPPEVGGPWHPASDTGVDKVASDGVSTVTVPAVPCSTAARETDGTTTCIGIPDSTKRGRAGVPEGTTTGQAR
jgi:hypothetical protein